VRGSRYERCRFDSTRFADTPVYLAEIVDCRFTSLSRGLFHFTAFERCVFRETLDDVAFDRAVCDYLDLRVKLGPIGLASWDVVYRHENEQEAADRHGAIVVG